MIARVVETTGHEAMLLPRSCAPDASAVKGTMKRVALALVLWPLVSTPPALAQSPELMAQGIPRDYKAEVGVLGAPT